MKSIRMVTKAVIAVLPLAAAGIALAAQDTAEQLKARKVDLIVADMGSEPVTQNGVSRMFFGMLALVAEFERERTRERLAEGRGAKRAAGGHIGGSAPFGYHKVGAGRSARLQPVPEQQDAILTMRRLAAEDASLRAIAEEVRQRHGFVVSHLAVRTALRRPAEELVVLPQQEV